MTPEHGRALWDALLCGAALGVLWILLRRGDQTCGKVRRFVADAVFVLTFAACYFAVCRRAYDGQFRLLPAAAQTAGTLFLLKGPGKWIERGLDRLIRRIKRALFFLLRPVFFTVGKAASLCKKITTFCKKPFIFLKKYIIIIYKSRIMRKQRKNQRRTDHESTKDQKKECARYYH